MAASMLASQTDSLLAAVAKVLWSLGSVSMYFLVLETSLGSLALATLVQVAVGLTVRVLGHQFQSQQASPHVQLLGWVDRLFSPLVEVLYFALELQDRLGPSGHIHLVLVLSTGEIPLPA